MGSVDDISSDRGACGHFDVIIVGAGFSGIYALHRCRKLGLKAIVFEAGSDLGGAWYWNRYPGARVDSEWPFYQLSIPEVWQDWDFSHRFPDHNEIRDYFAHADKILQLRKDIRFDARVNSATWSSQDGRWEVKTQTGHAATGKYLFLCTGLLHRQHYPEFPGLSNYHGALHHSASWPEDLDVAGKKVAVIGAGATSVQVIQELSKKARQLTMFMRRPSLCLPLGQREIESFEQTCMKPYFPLLFKEGRQSRAGFPRGPPEKSIYEVSEQEREEYYENIWKAGSFSFAMSNFREIMVDLKANRIAYDFWAKKTRARITDPLKRDLMAPREPPYAILTKRCPLEHDYYECLDQSHVEIVDLSASPLKEFTKTGISTEDGKTRDFDIVVLATGFDSFTGSVANMGLKNKHGVDIKDVWESGIRTYLGMLIRGFPNCFMSYTPQAPTALSNGPTILECQVDFVVDCIAKLEKEGAKTIEPTEQAVEDWRKLINDMANMTLFPLTNSWWNGANIPGKKVEMLTYVAGIGQYELQCRATLDQWIGFEVDFH